MKISDSVLNGMSDADLKLLAERAQTLVRKRGIDTELRQNLPVMVQHLVKAIKAEQDKPLGERKQTLDFSVTQKGFFRADDVLATPGYKEAVAALSEKYGVAIEIYQGVTHYSACGHMESDPDARVRVDLSAPDTLRADMAEIMEMIKTA